MKRRWRHAQRHGCNVWLPRCCPWGIPTTLLGLLACPSLNRDPYAAHYPSCEVVSGVNEIMRIIMITHSFEATRSKIDEFPLAGSLCYQWVFPTWKIPKSLMQDQYKLISICCCCCCCCCCCFIDLPSRRCRYSDASSTMLTLKSQTPCGSNGASCWDAKLGECYGSPKTPSAKSGTFSKQWTFTGVQIYTGHARTLAVASCCQVRNSNILSCGQRADTGAHTRDTRWVEMSPFLHTVRLCSTGSIKWTLEVWTNGPSDYKPTIRWQVNTAIEHVFAQNSGTKSDTLSDCGQLSKVIQQLKPLRETAIATMAGNTRPGHDQENFNCQFARYAFNLTSFPSGCVWKWGTPMYSHNWQS